MSGYFADWNAIHQFFFNASVAREGLPRLFTVALKNTVIYTITGFALGIILGLALALMRLSSVAPYRWLAAVYVEIFRGLPALVIFLCSAVCLWSSLGFPARRRLWHGRSRPWIRFRSIHGRDFRAGLQAVPKGQMEAARSLGMTNAQGMCDDHSCQAIRIVIPPLTNELVLLFKDSSLVLFLGVTSSQVELAKLAMIRPLRLRTPHRFWFRE